MIEIKNRFTGAVVYTSATATEVSVAVMEAVANSADLRSADLRSADLRSADLRSADLSFADLRSADLRSADLRSADLRSADLRSAKIGDHECDGRFIQLYNVAEWGPLLAFMNTAGNLRIVIGCRHMAYDKMLAHWADRKDRPMSRVALSMVDVWFQAVSK